MAQERKLATILFADIVGSTGFGGSREPEVVRRQLGEVFERMREVLVAHGGTVEKFIGDAVMSVFGAPLAHEDDAERAVRAALELRDRIAETGIGVRLRIGVDTGEVVAGDAHAGEPLVTGQVVIAAARLQESAMPGEILAGPLTRRLTRGAVRFGPIRSIEAKGMTVEAADVLGLTTTTPGGDRAAVIGLRAPLIGRDEEMQLLRDLVRRAGSERKAHLVTVFGEAGVGKSRLVREFAATLEPPVLRGRCLPYGRSITFWPLREMLVRDAGIESADDAAEAERKLRAVMGPADGAEADARALAVTIGEPATSSGDTNPGVDEITGAFRRYLERRAASGPAVMIVEDIHWAETAFLDLIEQLIPRVRTPLLVVCVTRPELFDRRPAWGAGRTDATALTLAPLTRDETIELARELLALAVLPDRLAERIVARTEGNPLYVEEYVRTLSEGDDPEKVPPTLQGIITARLDRLPEPVRKTLRRASVQGRDFWIETLRVLGDADAELRSRLAFAADRDFVLERDERGPDGEPAFRFRHVIIRDVVYGTIPKTERWQLHSRFAAWLAEAREPDADIAAYHLEQGFLLAEEVADREARTLGRSAFDALRAAATRARQRQDFAAALDLYERALRIGRRVGIDRAVLLDAEGFAAIQRLRLDPTPQSIAAFDGTLDAARAAGPSEVLARLLTWRITLATHRSLPEMRALLSELVAVARATGNPELVAQTLWFSHEPHWLVGDLEGDRRVLEDARAYAKQHAAVFALISSLVDLAINALECGEFTLALRTLAEAEGPSRVRGASLDRFKALAASAEATLETGDVERGRQLARDAQHLARSIGGPWAAVRAACLLADGHRAAGDRVASRAVLNEAMHALGDREPQTVQDTLPHLQWRMARACIEDGDLAAAETYVAAMRRATTSDVRVRARAVALDGALAAARGGTADGERRYREALALLEATGCALLRTHLKEELGQMLRAAGRGRDADAVLAEAAAFKTT